MHDRLPLVSSLAYPLLMSVPLAASYVRLPANISFLDVPQGGEFRTEHYTRDQLEHLAQRLRPSKDGRSDEPGRLAYVQVNAAISASDFRPNSAMLLNPGISTSGDGSMTDEGLPALAASTSSEPAANVSPVARNAAASSPTLRKGPKAGWIAGPVSLWGGGRIEGLKAMRVIPPPKDRALKGDAFALICAAQGQIFRLTLDGIRTDLVKTAQGRLPWLPRTWGMDEPADFIQLPDGTIECLTSMGRYYRLESDGTATLVDDSPLYGYAALELGPKGERLFLGSSGIIRLDPALAGMTRTQIAGGTWAAKSWEGFNQPQPALGASFRLRSVQTLQDGSMFLLSAVPRPVV